MIEYTLYRIEDNGTTTEISQHEDLLTGVAAGQYAVEVEDFDFAYALHSNGIKLASFADGRIGHREWCRRTGTLQDEYISSLDDKLDHDVEVI